VKRFEKYIFSPKIVPELPYHSTMRNVPVFIDKELCQDADIWVMIPKLPKSLKVKMGAAEEPHAHDVAQIYCFSQDIKAEVNLGENADEMETYLIEAPVTVYIPPNVFHTLALLETGDNPFGISILLKGLYKK
jgi:hypothetical protein